MPIVKEVSKVNDQDVEIYVEVENLPVSPIDDPYSDTRDAREMAQKAFAEVEGVFGDGLRLARNCAARTADVLLRMDEAVRPDEFEVQISVKLDAGVATLVQAGGHLQVTMKWKEKTDDDGKSK